ncbi:hypothetical protein GCM10018952_35420 [Streptosporangium vulgare]
MRLQSGAPGIGHYGSPGSPGGYPGSPYPDGWDVQRYLRDTPKLFERARRELGEEPGLMHDVHSRLTPKQAIVLARALEPYRLFFLEDPIAPEFYDRLPEVREAAPMPIAAGEQLGSVADAARIRPRGRRRPAAAARLVGGRAHPRARKLVALCELTGVGTAWHSPADVSPVGAAANVGARRDHPPPSRSRRGTSIPRPSTRSSPARSAPSTDTSTRTTRPAGGSTWTRRWRRSIRRWNISTSAGRPGCAPARRRDRAALRNL